MRPSVVAGSISPDRRVANKGGLQLLKEMDEMQAEGYPVDPDRLAISDRAHMVMP